MSYSDTSSQNNYMNGLEVYDNSQAAAASQLSPLKDLNNNSADPGTDQPTQKLTADNLAKRDSLIMLDEEAK